MASHVQPIYVHILMLAKSAGVGPSSSEPWLLPPSAAAKGTNAAAISVHVVMAIPRDGSRLI